MPYVDASRDVGMERPAGGGAMIARLREQAEALAEALEGLVEEVWPSEMIAEGMKPEKGVSVAGPVDGGTVADARAALRAYREPGSPAIHTKYLDDQLVERCITCLERWPCKEATTRRCCMNLIDLVEQAHAVVRVYEAGRLVDVVPVRYPEMWEEVRYALGDEELRA